MKCSDTNSVKSGDMGSAFRKLSLIRKFCVKILQFCMQVFYEGVEIVYKVSRDSNSALERSRLLGQTDL